MRKYEQRVVGTCEFSIKGTLRIIFLLNLYIRPFYLSIHPHRHSNQTPKMTSPKPSIMDEKPNLESFYRDMSWIAIAALAVHVSWKAASPGDHFGDWLVSAIPKILTGFLLLALLLDAAYNASDTHFFTLLKPSTQSESAGLRVSSNPDREDRHFLNVQVIAYTATLGVSIDITYIWYLLCQAIWYDLAKTEPYGLLLLVTFCTGAAGFFLLITWMPVYFLAGIGQRCGGKMCTESSENGDSDSSPELKTLIAAAEAYEKELRHDFDLPYHKYQRKDIIHTISDMLRRWQNSGH